MIYFWQLLIINLLIKAWDISMKGKNWWLRILQFTFVDKNKIMNSWNWTRFCLYPIRWYQIIPRKLRKFKWNKIDCYCFNYNCEIGSENISCSLNDIQNCSVPFGWPCEGSSVFSSFFFLFYFFIRWQLPIIRNEIFIFLIIFRKVWN